MLSDLPQVSFSRIGLSFDGGSRALLATPLSCGPATARGHFVPYSGSSAVDSSVSVDITGAGGTSCPANLPFAPSVTTGSTEAQAGQDTGFVLTLVRRDEEQLTRRFSVTLPAGVSAALGSVEPCPGAAAASAACPAGSRIGSAIAEFGSGPDPALMRGDVFLTDAYRGAPFGLAIAFHAALGPFDLGNVQVRGTLDVDRRTGQVTISTDSLPSVVEGIPVRFRTIGMDLDRPGLLRNPTSCQPDEVAAAVHALDGRVVSVASPFAVSGCDHLAFRPRLGSALIGRRLRAGGHPGLRLSVRMARRGANLGRFRIKLPRVLGFHAGGVRAICAGEDAVEGACTSSSRVGTAIVRTPLLKRPLRGPLYLAQPAGDGLPGFAGSLGAMGVKLDVVGRTLRRRGHLLTEVAGLPDMPISSFTMRIGGGKSGLFALRSGLCRKGRPRHLSSPAVAEAQNDAYRLERVPLHLAKNTCGGRRR